MKKILMIFLSLVTIGVIGYGSGVGYYAEKFQPNTTFAAVDISNLTLDQAKTEILNEMKKEAITILENGNEVGTITLESLQAEIDIDQMLVAAYKSQDPAKWLMSFFGSSKYDHLLMNQVQIDNRILDEKLMELGLNNQERTAPKNATIDYATSTGYVVTPESPGNQIDFDQLKADIIRKIQNGDSTVEINQNYAHPEITTDDDRITAVMDRIDQYTNTKINLEIAGETVTIPKEEIMQWIYFDGNNQLVIDQELVMEYLKTLNDQFATFNKPREFVSTLRGTVTVPPGTLGWSIDRESEAQQIADDLKNGQDVTRMPVIVGSGYGSGDDIGSTYVEVDITNQMMYVYQEGIQVLSTPVVTGFYGSSETVPGAYSIWNKERNAILEGFNVQRQQDYAQPVAFWMPFDDTGQGIHDAAWQSSFGGTAYLTSGSQGCINTPPDVMAQLFEIVDLGTPVVVF